MTQAADKCTEEKFFVINFSTTSTGVSIAESRFNHAAQRIAQNPADAGDPNTAVDTIQARNQYEANLKTLKMGDEMTQSTLNLLA